MIEVVGWSVQNVGNQITGPKVNISDAIDVDMFIQIKNSIRLPRHRLPTLESLRRIGRMKKCLNLT